MGSSRFSTFCIISLLVLVAAVGSGCSWYNRVMAQKNLVDGAQAYNQRHFEEATENFRRAVAYDPDGNMLESRTAQLFLARTLHSLFAGNRRDKSKAKEAIVEYKKALPGYLKAIADNRAAVEASPDDEKAKSTLKENQSIIGSIVRSIGSLHENLGQTDKWREWQVKSSENEGLPNDVRANALISLAAKKYACANDISDAKEVKKTVQKDGKSVFKYSKPEADEDFETLTKCVEDGTGYIDRAIKLNGKSDSAWSYRASLLDQKMRIAEMEGNTDERSELEKSKEEATAKFKELAKIKKEKQEEEARKKAEEEAKKDGGKKKESSDQDAKEDK